MDKITNPHDKYFRASMSDPRIAKDFFQAHLPETILNSIKWETLALQSSQHIDEHLSETMTDILYRVAFGEGNGFITILVEHQSKSDPMMAFRVLHYSISIMRRELLKNPGSKLPLVVPIVFYSGQEPYRHTTDVFELFGDLEPLARNIFMNPFQLVDVGRIPDEELRQHTWVGVMELVQKHIFTRDFVRFIRGLAPLLRELMGQNADEYIFRTLKYICNTAGLDDPSEFARIINNELSEELGGKAMTLAQIWHSEGLEKGLEKGRQEGRQEAQEVIAQKMLVQGADPAFVSKVTGLAFEELELLN